MNLDLRLQKVEDSFAELNELVAEKKDYILQTQGEITEVNDELKRLQGEWRVLSSLKEEMNSVEEVEAPEKTKKKTNQK